MEAEVDADLTGCDIGDHLRNEERTELRTLIDVLAVINHLILEGLDAADADAVDYTYAVLVHSVKVEFAVLHSLHGSSHTQLGATVHLAYFLPVDIVVRIEVFYLASELSLELGSVKQRNRSSATLSLQQVGPCLVNVVAERGQCAHSCYYYSI